MNAANALPASLAVFMADRLIGTLHNENPLPFSYAPAWLANPTATPIEPKIPLTAEKINTPYILAFFENPPTLPIKRPPTPAWWNDTTGCEIRMAP